MNSFFGDDTAEEDKLVANILKKKDEEDVDRLPRIVDEILTSHLAQSVIKAPKEAETQVKSEDISKAQDYYKENTEVIQKYSKEEKLNFPISAHIFSFHIKKNGRINADLYFIPYKSHDNKDIITEYTHNYGYYDIYSKNIEQENKSIHSIRIDKKHKLKETTTNSKEADGIITNSNKKIRVKSEVEDLDAEIKQEEKIKDKTSKKEKTEVVKNFQKWLVHFRGRLFIGCEILYSFFKISTFLGTIQNRNMHDKSIEGFKMFDKKIQTYNLIKNATYWKQDAYPDISDQNIQRLLFFLLIPPLNDIEKEEEGLQSPIVF